MECLSLSFLKISRLCFAMSASAGRENAGRPPAIFLHELPSPSLIRYGFIPASAIYLKSELPAIPPPAIIAGTFSTHLLPLGSMMLSLFPTGFISPSVTRFDIGPRGVGSPITSIPYGLRYIFALGTHLFPRQGPIPILVMCLSSSDDITFLSPIAASIFSTVTSSQWQMYVLASCSPSSCFIFTGCGYFSLIINPLTARRASPSRSLAFTLATLVLLSFLRIFSITPSPTFFPLLSTRKTSAPSSALYSIGRKIQFLLNW